MSDGWKSESESRSKPVSIPQPSESGAGNKSADVMDSNPQWGHGKFGAGSWDPSTSEAAPKASGFDSQSESRTGDSPHQGNIMPSSKMPSWGSKK